MADKGMDERVSMEDIAKKDNFDYEGAKIANKKYGASQEGRDLLSSGSKLSVDVLDEAAEKASLENQVSHDRLTGLKSERELSKVLKEIEDENAPATVFFVDIDHFKDTNDTYGHKVGDDVLTILGERLMSHIEGVVGRKGGEEFLVILKGDIPLEVSQKRAEEIRLLMEQTPFAINPDLKLSKTVSLGVSKRKLGEKSEDWVSRADGALYLAKQTGRNNVKVWENDLDGQRG